MPRTSPLAIVVVVAIGAPMAAVIARVRPDDSLAEQRRDVVSLRSHRCRDDRRGHAGAAAEALVRLGGRRGLGRGDDVEQDLSARALAQRCGRRVAGGHRGRDLRLVCRRDRSRASSSARRSSRRPSPDPRPDAVSANGIIPPDSQALARDRIRLATPSAVTTPEDRRPSGTEIRRRSASSRASATSCSASCTSSSD